MAIKLQYGAVINHNNMVYSVEHKDMIIYNNPLSLKYVRS